VPAIKAKALANVSGINIGCKARFFIL
jgi:hypothetical protein